MRVRDGRCHRARRGAAAASLAIVTAALFGAPGLATAAQTAPTTFGADLTTRQPQSQATCETVYEEPTCTLSTNADQLGGTGESFLVPQGPDAHGTGTITAFHVKVGAVTGPMQILLLQALRQQQQPGMPAMPAACCSVVNATSFFTPAANETTTIPVSWPTEADSVPNPDNDVFAFDVMALSVSQGVPLPAALQRNASDSFWAPACVGTIGNECDYAGGAAEYVVTMSADWVPNPGTTNPTGNPPNPNPPAAGPPSLLAATASGKLKGSTVPVPLSCSTAECIGAIQLQNFEANGATAARKHRAKHVTYGKASFTIGAGASKTIKVKLNHAGRKLVKHHRHVRMWLNITVKGGATVSRRFTIKHG
jgi:hypothetical protein